MMAIRPSRRRSEEASALHTGLSEILSQRPQPIYWNSMRRRDACLLLAAAPAAAADFVSKWPANAEQVWLGPEYWANRLQDWRVANGRIECVAAGGGPQRIPPDA